MIAIVYAVTCFAATSMVSGAVSDYIGKHGWKTFNKYMYASLFLCLGGVGGLAVKRLTIQWPSWKAWIVAVITAVATFEVYTDAVLLPSELVHIPQFAIGLLLLLAAFPRDAWVAVVLCAVGGVADEWTQSFFPDRVLDLNDIFLNWLGLLYGLVAYWAWTHPPRNPHGMDTTDVE